VSQKYVTISPTMKQVNRYQAWIVLHQRKSLVKLPVEEITVYEGQHAIWHCQKGLGVRNQILNENYT